MRILLSFLVVPCILACFVNPVSAIEVYQADTIQPEKPAATPAVTPADTIAPRQGKTVDPYHAPTVEVYHGGGTTPLYQVARTLEPGGGLSPAPPYQRMGILQYQPLAEWEPMKEGTALIFTPPDMTLENLCIIMMMSPESVTDATYAWFEKAIARHLDTGVKMVAKGPVLQQQSTAGDPQLFTTMIVEKPDGKRIHMAYTGMRQGETGQVVAYAATRPEEFITNLPNMVQFTRNLKLDGGAVPVSDPAKPAPDAKPSLTSAVEPLSNRLELSMTADQVIAKFGKPAMDDRFWGGGMGYDDFAVMFNAAGTQITHFTIKKNIRLAGGISAGSPKTDVLTAYPRGGQWVYDQYKVTFDQYALTFLFNGDAVSAIKIDPAKGTFIPPGTVRPDPSPAKPDPKPAGGKGDAAKFIGTWHGTAQTVGTLVVRADGTYGYNGTEKAGTYTVKGNEIFFTGVLKPWDNGRATLTKGNLEFYWKNPDGSINWFSFAQ
ncbi:MAG: hypothetical protein BWY76_02649 [bacterium ADurb.Bin429]|nr:MAG: hypothetical protein BWY76_02649 [bacterium ADurb.Bin429]